MRSGGIRMLNGRTPRFRISRSLFVFFFCGSFFLGGGNWGLGFVCCILQAREIGAMKQIERANIL